MRIFKLLLLLITYQSISATENEIKLENISTFSGLSTARAKCVFQDSRGYIWIGTMGGGLNLYDGYSFTVFKHKANDSTSLISNNVFELAEDEFGDIWIAASGGISKYVVNENKFINYDFEEYFSELPGVNYTVFFSVHIDSKNRLWFGSSNFGALMYDNSDNKFKLIRQQSSTVIDNLPQRYGDITEDSSGKIWASVGSAGLYWFDEEGFVFRPAPMDKEDFISIKENLVFRIYADSEDNIWVMTSTNLYKYLPSEQILIDLLNYEITNPINQGKEGALWEDSEGNMWIVHINMDHPVQFPNLSDNYNIVKTKKISASDFYIDSFGIYWICDFFQGVYKHVPNKQEFHQLDQISDDQKIWSNSLIINISKSLVKPEYINVFSRQGRLIQLYVYNVNTGEYEEFNVNQNSTLLVTLPNADGTFWLGYRDLGLIKWNPYTNESKQYFSSSSDRTNLDNKSISALHRDNENNLWIGSFNGLYRIDQNEENLEMIIPEIDVTSIITDENVIWIGTYGGGFLKYNKYSQKITNYKFKIDSNSISNDIVVDIYRDKEGYLWLATEGGLNRFDLRTSEFKVFQEADGLVNDQVRAIIRNDNGNLSISTIAGISIMHMDDNNSISFSNYDSMDGLLNPYFRHGVKLKDKNGRIFFGGQGLYYFKQHTSKSIPPETYISDVKINGESIFQSNIISSKRSEFHDQELNLSHDQNTILIKLLALHYSQPSRNRYSYYLENYESDWNYTNMRDVQYINLDPGKYNFHLRAANRDGVWNSEEIVLSIVIDKPWWNTFYAYLAYFGIIIGSLGGIRRFELQRSKENEKKRLLEAENQRKSEELEEARELQLSMLPREIPKIPNLDIAVYMITATEVGGDYYDFHVGLDGTLTAVIGDATGHGMKAGTVVTASKSLFNSFASNIDILFSFKEMSRCIKDLHLQNLSMCLTMLKIRNNKLSMSSAGMPPIYLYRKETDAVEEHQIEGMPLGAMSNFPYVVKETELNCGDIILLMSDGFPELINNKNEMLGYKKTRNIFQEIGSEEPEIIIDELKRIGSEWVQDRDPDDDVTFVVIKVK